MFFIHLNPTVFCDGFGMKPRTRVFISLMRNAETGSTEHNFIGKASLLGCEEVGVFLPQPKNIEISHIQQIFVLLDPDKLQCLKQ